MTLRSRVSRLPCPRSPSFPQNRLHEQTSCFWYFFFGVIIFGFYITNLFVGVMFEAFLSYKNLDSQSRLVSQEERRWRDYEKRLLQVRRGFHTEF